MTTANQTKPERNPRGQFLQGFTGNRSGRPRGSRNKLAELFLTALVADFEQHGRDAIAEARLTNPSVYLRVVASLLPREPTSADATATEFDKMTDQELRDYISTSMEEQLAESAAEE